MSGVKTAVVGDLPPGCKPSQLRPSGWIADCRVRPSFIFCLPLWPMKAFGEGGRYPVAPLGKAEEEHVQTGDPHQRGDRCAFVGRRQKSSCCVTCASKGHSCGEPAIAALIPGIRRRVRFIASARLTRGPGSNLKPLPYSRAKSPADKASRQPSKNRGSIQDIARQEQPLSTRRPHPRRRRCHLAEARHTRRSSRSAGDGAAPTAGSLTLRASEGDPGLSLVALRIWHLSDFLHLRRTRRTRSAQATIIGRRVSFIDGRLHSIR